MPEKVVVGVPSVLMIYPSTDVLPANLLKFYLQFSRPMRETDAIFDHIRIIDDQGNVIEDPWRRAPLWSNDGTRLTLLIHPGRIKTGVNLNLDLGPLGLDFLLANAASGYFPRRLVKHHLRRHRLRIPARARTFTYPVYMVYPEARDEEAEGE